MHNDEIWQKYNHNGTSCGNEGHSPSDFKQYPNDVMGNSHIWFWKKSDTGSVDILLQKRAVTKVSKPGMYHISAGGHINVGESPVEAAKRETQEEMGVELDEQKLYYVGSMRLVTINPNSIVNVFLYELSGNEQFNYLDGEVDSVEWRSLENFKHITSEPDSNNLINQGQPYFTLLIDSLEHISRKPN